VNEEGTEVGVVQIHPDAVSMEFHMGVQRWSVAVHPATQWKSAMISWRGKPWL
jgi:hypothetical protein